MRIHRKAGLWIVLGGLAACSFAPEYKEPEATPAPAQYKEAGEWKPAEPADSGPRGEWWKMFGDPALDALQERVVGANQNLRAALARLDQARAQTQVARADLLPTVTAGPTVTRSRTSINSPRYPNGAPPVGNNFALTADFDYEVDLWGRIRNQVAAAGATQQASAADLATLDLSIRAELVVDYFSLRSLDAQQALLDRTVYDYAESLRLIQNLYNGGGAALTDVAQARAQLETARTQSADLQLQRDQTEHAIAVLVGENPSSFSLDARPLPTDFLPPQFASGSPSELLERRPDIASAERRVAAANSEIGVARAAYFPVFSLSGLFGYDSTHPSTWLNAPSKMWSIGPTAALTVFDAGRHGALSAQAHAAYDERVADYRNTVLTAYQEVEDNLAALRQLQQESVSQSAAVTAVAS